MNQRLSLAILPIAFVRTPGIQVRHADEVFTRWIDEDDGLFQHIFEEVDLSTMSDLMDQEFLCDFKKMFSENYALFKPFAPFIASMFDVSLDNKSDIQSLKLTPKARQNFIHFYDALENDMSEFVRLLKHNGFASMNLNKLNAKGGFNRNVDRYKRLIAMMFDIDDEDDCTDTLFAVANCFVEYCFNPATHNQLMQLFKQEDGMYCSIAHMMYSIMWHNLGCIGWKNWSETCLKRLKKCAQQGKTVVYIAGGNDIYYLLQYGIYNIVVVDPMISVTQEEYYIKHWSWLFIGEGKDHGVGDVLIMDDIILRRDAVERGKKITVTRSDDTKERISQSVTTWSVWAKGPIQVKLGSVVYDRRYATQSDFNRGGDKEILISFNELYFVVLPKYQDGWPIEPHKMQSNVVMHVKQLHSPVTRKMMLNMQDVEKKDLSWVSLGSSIT